MKPIVTIDDVLAALDEITDDCIARQNPSGAFAALYRSVTASVKKGIREGRFEDGRRMERLDVVFALRYIDAWHAYHAQQPVTEAWKVAMDAGQRTDLFYLQHLFLGMNAHINLDLGIAAAAVSPDEQLAALKNDFMEINTLLSEMTQQVQAQLAKVSPLLGLLDRLARHRDEQLAGFSLRKARDHAWNIANLLAPVSQDQWPGLIEGIDKQVVRLGKLIVRPSGYWWRIAYQGINWMEKKDTGDVIQRLRIDVS